MPTCWAHGSEKEPSKVTVFKSFSLSRGLESVFFGALLVELLDRRLGMWGCRVARGALPNTASNLLHK